MLELPHKEEFLLYNTKYTQNDSTLFCLPTTPTSHTSAPFVCVGPRLARLATDSSLPLAAPSRLGHRHLKTMARPDQWEDQYPDGG
jgi:hypothetical protein